MAIQNGGNNWYHNGYAAVIKPYKAHSPLQMIRWFDTKVKNIRDPFIRCLDVYAGRDIHNYHLHWWRCHNGISQQWYIDQKGYNYPKQPLASGVKFQIKSKMRGNRAVKYHEHIGNHQYRLRLQDNDPSDKRQWWTFDARTQTIRSFYVRHFCIGNQLGQGFIHDRAVNARPYKGRNQDKIRWYNGPHRNIRNNAGGCLAVHGGDGHNYNNRHLIFWKCTNGAYESWYIDQVGAMYHKPQIEDNVKFQIRSKLPGNRALFFHEKINAHTYRLRIQNHQPWNDRQWFYFDSRTKSIRSSVLKSFAISVQPGQ